MANVAVLDAGVALAWFIYPPSVRKEYALRVLAAYRKEEIRFIVPDIFFIEVPYVLMKAMNKGAITKQNAAQGARFIDLVTNDVVPSRMSVINALERAFK